MGADAYAYTIFGVLVPFKTFYTKKKIKNFKHDYDESMNFCPVTGRPLWGVETEYVEEFNEVDEKIGEFNYVYQDHYCDEDKEDDQMIFLGKVTETRYNKSTVFNPFDANEIETLKAKLKAFLEKYNAWDEKSFGVYTHSYLSY